MLGCGDVWGVRVGGGRGCCFRVIPGMSGYLIENFTSSFWSYGKCVAWFRAKVIECASENSLRCQDTLR
jgi:hypothetical protein